MRKTLVIVASVGVLAVVGGMTLASASRHDAQHAWGAPFARSTVGGSAAVAFDSDGDERLVLISRNESFVNIDNPPEGFSQGDQQAISSPLFNSGGEKVGFLDVHVVVTYLNEQARRERELVTFTATLPGGQLEATGVFRFSENAMRTTAGITGGSMRCVLTKYVMSWTSALTSCSSAGVSTASTPSAAVSLAR